jgi:hypothetical protein
LLLGKEGEEAHRMYIRDLEEPDIELSVKVSNQISKFF